jgi:hypothetical protein
MFRVGPAGCIFDRRMATPDVRQASAADESRPPRRRVQADQLFFLLPRFARRSLPSGWVQ